MAKSSDKTVDMFSGKTQEEVNNEAERIREGLDNVEQPKTGQTIEQSADRYRANAFVGQEWTSLLFGDPRSEEHEYRVSLKNGYVYLERTAAGSGTGGAWAYAGIMVPEADLPRIATVLVKATREYLKRKGGSGEGG